jgi:hypothetical protein
MCVLNIISIYLKEQISFNLLMFIYISIYGSTALLLDLRRLFSSLIFLHNR